MAEVKTRKTDMNAVAFVNAVKDEKKRADAKELLKIFKEATGMRPSIWGQPRDGGVAHGFVGYGSYHYKSDRSTQEGDWPMTGFSPRVQNLTIYVMPGFKDFAPELKKLGKHTVSGGSCIYIKRLSDIHVPTLKSIIKKSVAMMKKKYG